MDNQPLLGGSTKAPQQQQAPTRDSRVGGLGPGGYGATNVDGGIYTGSREDARAVHVPSVDTEQTLVW